MHSSHITYIIKLKQQQQQQKHILSKRTKISLKYFKHYTMRYKMRKICSKISLVYLTELNKKINERSFLKINAQ